MPVFATKRILKDYLSFSETKRAKKTTQKLVVIEEDSDEEDENRRVEIITSAYKKVENEKIKKHNESRRG